MTIKSNWPLNTGIHNKVFHKNGCPASASMHSVNRSSPCLWVTFHYQTVLAVRKYFPTFLWNLYCCKLNLLFYALPSKARDSKSSVGHPSKALWYIDKAMLTSVPFCIVFKVLTNQLLSALESSWISVLSWLVYNLLDVPPRMFFLHVPSLKIRTAFFFLHLSVPLPIVQDFSDKRVWSDHQLILSVL